MRETRIEAADPNLVDKVARQCGELAIGCTDAGGQVQAVADTIGKQIAVLGELETVMKSLETDQRQVTDATDEARLLSETARKRLQEGGETIAASIAEFGELTQLVTRLGTQITSFASAMDQVKRTTETIDSIARTTNMLALNAAIEAEKAGDAGRTFAVVAAEVKKLARDTRAATEEIGATMASLTREAETFVSEVGEGATRSRDAEKGFARVNETVSEVTRLVEQVDRQADDIARSTSLIHDSVCRVGDELGGFSKDSRANNDRLGEAFARMGALEVQANGMLDNIVHSGFAHNDRHFVDMTLNAAVDVQELVEAAIAAGEVKADDVFDTVYRPIEGTDPPQFDNRFNAFAEKHLQPILDRVAKLDPRVIGTAVTDINSYLPTHMTSKSHPQRPGDPKWNGINCRNKRILMDDATARAVASDADYMLSTYRQDLGASGYRAIKNCFVPLRFNGRRWGNFEIAYVD